MLVLSSLSSGYNGSVVNRDISFSVARGEVLALIGRNGVGKTTLARTVIGLQRTLSGTIVFDGADVTRISARRRARLGIGYVPQGRGIFADLTVEENLRMGQMIGGAYKPLDYAFDLFPVLKERRRQLGGTLSGGQQQMLSIGRVLIGQPKLLLLDEPSDGIQPSIVEQIGELCRTLNARDGLTILLIEQNLDLIMASADRCLLMEKGAITEEFDPSRLEDPAVARRALAI
jgi:urea ABC transporter ATP-binding protein UrtE